MGLVFVLVVLSDARLAALCYIPQTPACLDKGMDPTSRIRAALAMLFFCTVFLVLNFLVRYILPCLSHHAAASLAHAPTLLACCVCSFAMSLPSGRLHSVPSVAAVKSMCPRCWALRW
jgi:hypothetical protein